jgi:hypothetical protein
VNLPDTTSAGDPQGGISENAFENAFVEPTTAEIFVLKIVISWLS